MQYLKSKYNSLIYIGGKMRLKALLVLAAVCVAFIAAESFAAGTDTSYSTPDTCYSAPDTCYVCRTLDSTEQTPRGTITQLDLGICDTVRIGCPVCANFSSVAVGDSFRVPIYIYSSNAIDAFSLGFRHDGRRLKFGGYNYAWDPAGGILTSQQQAGIQWTIDTITEDEPKPDSGSALMGWINFSGKRPIARNTIGVAQLVGSIWLVLTDTIRQTIRFDSVFYPPAGPFILTCRDSTGPTTFIVKKLTPKFVRCSEVASPPCDINLADTPCGDVDGSRDVSIADAVYMISYIFGHSAPPQDPWGGDIDCDLSATIADVVYLIEYIFAGGPKPCFGCE
jgi:hypothetical protein